MSAFVLLLSHSIALAQDPPPPEDGESTEELRQRVRTLEHAIDELRGVADGTQAEIPLDLEMRLRAYGALNLNYLDEEQTFAFNLDDILLQYTANLDRKMTANLELSIEVEEEGAELETEAFEMVYAPRPEVQVVAGAFNTPLSPWADNASQGAFRYLPTSVPSALKEGERDEFLPLDQLGMQVRGRIPLGFWQLSYDTAMSNGRAPDPGVAARLFDTNNFKALTGRVSLQAPLGLSFGVGAYYDLIDVHDPSLLEEEGEETVVQEGPEEWAKETVIDDAGEGILSATVHWHGGPVELSSEAFIVVHSLDGASYTSFSGFVLVGVPIKKTTPYLMIDTEQVNQNDPVYQYFDQKEPEVEFLPGFRYDLGLRLSLKAQTEVVYVLESGEWEFGAQGQIAAGF